MQVEMSEEIVIGCLATLITSIIILYWCMNTKKKNQRFYELGRKFKGPLSLPIIGNTYKYGSNAQDFLKVMIQMTDEYGVFANWVGSILYVFTSNAEDAEIILGSKTTLSKSYIYKFFKPWLGEGLITSEGEQWQKHRKIITPAFHFKVFENYLPVFRRHCNVLIQNLEAELNKEEFNIESYIDKCTLNIMCETAMATEIQSEKKGSEFQKSIQKTSYAVLYRSFKSWLSPNILFNLSSTGRMFNKSVKFIQDFVTMIIERRREQFSVKNRKKYEDHDISSNGVDSAYKKRVVFMDLLLELAADPKTKLTDVEIRDEVNTFMFAGQDTTKSAICFVIYLLSRYPEVQNKVVEEIKQVFGDLDDKPMAYNDLIDMKYLERVIKETLRLYPSVPYIARTVTEELTLSNGQTLPVDSNVVVFIYKLHRDANIFPDPEEFNPDNFLPDKMVGRHPYAYCPFSAGPRNCIGQKFAMLEIKEVVISILRQYCLLPGKTELNLVSELTLHSSSGIYVAIENRD